MTYSFHFFCLFFFFIAIHPFIILLFCVRNAYVVAYEIKIHLNRLHCSVSYANVLSFCFHAPDSHNVVATWWLILGSCSVHAAPKLCPSCLPSHSACPPLSSQGMGSYKHLPSFLCPLPFTVGFFFPKALHKSSWYHNHKSWQRRSFAQGCLQARGEAGGSTESLQVLLDAVPQGLVFSASFQQPASSMPAHFSNMGFI